MPRKCSSAHHAITVENLIQFASQLPRSELDELIAALLALRDALDLDEQKRSETTIEISTNRKQKGKSAHIAWKIINGCGPYPYLRFRDGKKYRSYYLKDFRR